MIHPFPVWPWDRAWAVWSSMPWTDFALMLLAVAAAVALPLLLHWRPTLPRAVWVGLGLLLGWGLLLLARFGSVLEAPLLALLLFGPAALAGLSLGSYLGEPRGATTRVPPDRMAVVFWLRAAALLLVLLAIARPALGWEEPIDTRSAVLVLLDSSRSMSVVDEAGNVSRWQRMESLLEEARPALERLKRAGTDVRLVRFDQDRQDCELGKLGLPDGKSTDFGTVLHKLYEERSASSPPRALLIISDGADNGTAFPALTEAARWRAARCLVHVLPVGDKTTSTRQNDAALVSITTLPRPYVPVKGKLTIRVGVEAHGGLQGKKAKLRFFVEAPDEKGKVTEEKKAEREIALPRDARAEEQELTVDAPPVPCEAKVRVVVEPSEPDSLPLNNTIETFVTVSQEGTKVLLVGRRQFEFAAIHDALVADPRIRVTPVQVGEGGKLPLDGQPFDAIILADVKAAELTAIDKEALEKIEKMVGKGAGLMLLGGERTFNEGGWGKSPLADALPVEFAEDAPGVEEETTIAPTDDGLRRAKYLFALGGPDAKKAWEGLPKLEGFNELKPRKKAGVEELAKARYKGPADKEEKTGTVLVVGGYSSGKEKGKGQARVLVFGTNGTERWTNTEEGLPLFERFWRRTAVWLAQQEDAGDGVWVRPYSRRIPVRTDLGFLCGLRARGGGEMPGAKLGALVINPAGEKAKVRLSRGRQQTEGIFRATQAPGIYTLVVRGEGKDATGKVVRGEARARVIVYDEDVELTRPAADPTFLEKLAADGGGKVVHKLGDFLDELAERPVTEETERHIRWPDWDTRDPSGFLGAFMTLFCLVICLEWGLRRWWGMV